MKTFNDTVNNSKWELRVGIMLRVWADEVVVYFVGTGGVLWLGAGGLGIFSYFARAKARKEAGIRGVFPVVALGSALFGAWLVIMPEFFISILMYVLGALLVLGGVNQLVNFMAVRSYMHVPAGMYVLPLLILAAGVVVLFNPFEAAEVPFIFLGASAVVYSLTDLLRLIRFRRRRGPVAIIVSVDTQED